MAININGLRYLLLARDHGVDFSATATIGRQQLKVTRADFGDLCRAHLGPIGEDVLDRTYASGYADALLRLLGAQTVHSFDRSDFEGATHCWDFNEAIPAELHQAYTAVIDGGTLEHVFNFPVALRNCMDMVRLGGHFLSISPANNYMGHGFYQFSPELYRRALSEENGYAVVEQFVYELGNESRWLRALDPAEARRQILISTHRPVLTLTTARRIAVRPIFATIPQQSVYANAWTGSSPFVPAEPRRRWRVTALIPPKLAAVLRGLLLRPLMAEPGLLVPIDAAALSATTRAMSLSPVHECPICRSTDSAVVHADTAADTPPRGGPGAA